MIGHTRNPPSNAQPNRELSPARTSIPRSRRPDSPPHAQELRPDADIARSRFGLVVLSKPFFAKGWPHYELDGLVAMAVEIADEVAAVIQEKP